MAGNGRIAQARKQGKQQLRGGSARRGRHGYVDQANSGQGKARERIGRRGSYQASTDRLVGWQDVRWERHAASRHGGLCTGAHRRAGVPAGRRRGSGVRAQGLEGREMQDEADSLIRSRVSERDRHWLAGRATYSQNWGNGWGRGRGAVLWCGGVGVARRRVEVEREGAWRAKECLLWRGRQGGRPPATARSRAGVKRGRGFVQG